MKSQTTNGLLFFFNAISTYRHISNFMDLGKRIRERDSLVLRKGRIDARGRCGILRAKVLWRRVGLQINKVTSGERLQAREIERVTVAVVQWKLMSVVICTRCLAILLDNIEGIVMYICYRTIGGIHAMYLLYKVVISYVLLVSEVM